MRAVATLYLLPYCVCVCVCVHIGVYMRVHVNEYVSMCIYDGGEGGERHKSDSFFPFHHRLPDNNPVELWEGQSYAVKSNYKVWLSHQNGHSGYHMGTIVCHFKWLNVSPHKTTRLSLKSWVKESFYSAVERADPCGIRVKEETGLWLHSRIAHEVPAKGGGWCGLHSGWLWLFL